jgi:hypothetical protein
MNATIGDEFIRAGQNMLLTFTNIRGKAFEPTLAAILDMNTALGGGPEGLTRVAIQVGKALNDPATGLTALRRVGVTFSAQQVKRIKALQKEGKLYEAQKIILAELNKEFGGSFLAGGGTTAGKVAKFTDSIEDLQRALATALLPAVGNIADALSDLLADPQIIQGAKDLGEEIGKLFSAENVKAGAKVVGDVIRSIRDAAPTIGRGLGAAATAIGAVLNAFSKLPPEVQNLAIGALAVNKLTGGLITNIAGGLLSGLRTIIAGNVTVVGKTVVGPGGLPGGTAPAGGLAAIGLGPIIAAAVAAAFVHHESSTAFANALRSEGIPNKLDQFNIDIVGSIGRLIEVVRVGQRILNPPTPAASPDRQEAAQTAKLEKIAATLVAANALRREERGRGKAPGASTATQNDIAELAAKLGRLPENTGTVIPGAINSLRDSSLASIAALGANVTTTGATTTTATKQGSQIVANTTRSSVYANAAIVAGATRAGTAAIVSAIFAARPVINVTHVTRNNTIQNRYGPGTGSYGQPAHDLA